MITTHTALYYLYRQSKHLQTLLLPILWLDQGAHINDEGMTKFKSSFFNLQKGEYLARGLAVRINQ